MKNRKLSFIVIGLVVAVGAGVFIAKSLYESKIRNGIESFLANLPAPMTAKAEKIEVSFFGKSVTITNISGNHQDATFAIAKLEATGINIDAMKPNAGITKIADKILVHEATSTFDFARAHVEQYVYENVSGDMNRIMDAFIQSYPALVEASNWQAGATTPEQDKALFKAFIPILESLETMTVGRLWVQNYSYSLPIVDKQLNVLMGEMTAEDYSIREMGAMSLNGVTATIGEAANTFFSLEFASMESAVLPSFVPFFRAIVGIEDPVSGMDAYDTLSSAFKGQTFRIQNLQCKNLVVNNPEDLNNTIFSLNNFTFNYSAETTHELNTSYSGLQFSKNSLIAIGAPADVLALLPESITFSSATNVKATPSQGTQGAYDVDIAEYSFKEATLGEFSVKGSLAGIHIVSPPGRTATLKNFDLVVIDAGASDIFMAVNAKTQGISPEEARATMLAELPPLETMPNDTLRSLAASVRSFLEKSGNTLRITLAPEQPLTLELLSITALMEPEKLGLSASSTPTQ